MSPRSPFRLLVLASALLVVALASVACSGTNRATIVQGSPPVEPMPLPFTSSFKAVTMADFQQQIGRRTINAATFGANGEDRNDDTNALQKAFDAVPDTGATVRLPAGTYFVSTRLSITRPTALVGAGQNQTRIVASGQGYHLLDATRSFAVSDLSLERAPAAVNSAFKAINLNLYRASVTETPLAELVVERVAINGFDIGIYADGGAGMLVTNVLVRNVQVESNRLTTAQPTTGYTPTVNINRAAQVEVTGSELTQPLERQSNNIYMIGSERIRITDNAIRGGVGIKVVSGEFRAIKEVAITNNRFKSTSLSVLLITEKHPFEGVQIENNEFTQSRVVAAGSADVLITTQSGYRAQPYAYRQVQLLRNRFRDVARGVVRVEMGDGNEFGTLTLDGNTYERWGTAEPGSYDVVSTGRRGRYNRLIVRGETADGQGIGRAYIGASNFASAAFGSVVERGVRAPVSTRNEQSRLNRAVDQTVANLPPAEDERRQGVNLSEEEKRRFVSKYESRAPQGTMRIELVGGELRAIVPGQPVYTLVPVSPTRFRLQNTPDGFFVEFNVDKGIVKSLTVERGRYPKVVLYPVR